VGNKPETDWGIKLKLDKTVASAFIRWFDKPDVVGEILKDLFLYLFHIPVITNH